MTGVHCEGVAIAISGDTACFLQLMCANVLATQREYAYIMYVQLSLLL